MPARLFAIEKVKEVAEDVVSWIEPNCTRLELVGSVRRGRSQVHDLDILLIPRGIGLGIQAKLFQMHHQELIHLTPEGGEGQFRFVHCRTGIPVDVYIASDLDDWWGKLVVLTGSKDWLAKVRSMAHRNVFAFHADGRIEIAKGKFRRPRSEKDVFRFLGIAHVPPEART